MCDIPYPVDTRPDPRPVKPIEWVQDIAVFKIVREPILKVFSLPMHENWSEVGFMNEQGALIE